MVSPKGEFPFPLIRGSSTLQKLTILFFFLSVQGFICIPKSVSQSRIKSNTDLYGFELTEGEVKELDALDEYLITDWDVTETP